MTLEEQILKYNPNWSKYAVQGRIRQFQNFDETASTSIEICTPRIPQAPEYLSISRLGAAFKYLTYGEVCEYAWDLSRLQGFDAVIAVAKRFGLEPKMEEPAGKDDLILPSIFYGFMWNTFKAYDITQYAELANKCLDLAERYHQPTSVQKSFLQAKGLHVKAGAYSMEFTVIDNNYYVDKFEQDGFVVIYNYEVRRAELIEAEIQKVHPSATLQFDRLYGVVVR